MKRARKGAGMAGDEPIFSLGMVHEVFDGHDVVFFDYRGQKACIALQLGRALGYAQDGRTLLTLIGGQWADGFIDGTHVDVLTGKDRSDFLGLLEVIQSEWMTSLKYAPKVTIVYEPGLWAIIGRSDMEIGKRFRLWYETQVMPRMSKGEAVALPGAPNAMSLPAPGPQPPALVDHDIRRMEAEAALLLARAELVRQERLENLRADRERARRRRKPVVVHAPEPVTKALPPPVPPAPKPTPPNDMDRARRKKRPVVVEEQPDLQLGPPLPRGPKPAPIPTGVHPRRHGVCGHWVNQRCGKGRAFTKRIWVHSFERGGKTSTPAAGSEAG